MRLQRRGWTRRKQTSPSLPPFLSYKHKASISLSLSLSHISLIPIFYPSHTSPHLSSPETAVDREPETLKIEATHIQKTFCHKFARERWKTKEKGRENEQRTSILRCQCLPSSFCSSLAPHPPLLYTFLGSSGSCKICSPQHGLETNPFQQSICEHRHNKDFLKRRRALLQHALPLRKSQPYTLCNKLRQRSCIETRSRHPGRARAVLRAAHRHKGGWATQFFLAGVSALRTTCRTLVRAYSVVVSASALQ